MGQGIAVVDVQLGKFIINSCSELHTCRFVHRSIVIIDKGYPFAVLIFFWLHLYSYSDLCFGRQYDIRCKNIDFIVATGKFPGTGDTLIIAIGNYRVYNRYFYFTVFIIEREFFGNGLVKIDYDVAEYIYIGRFCGRFYPSNNGNFIQFGTTLENALISQCDLKITVSGNCNFKVTLGDQCVFESSSELDEIPIIAGIKPAAEATDVDVFSDIIVDFNQPVSKEFTLDDEDSKVKISVVDTIVTYGNNQRVTGTWKFSGSNNEVYVFTPDIILPSETQITVTVKVKPEEYKYGKWIPFIDDNNAPVYESASVQFTTGIYDKLTELNIDYSYPLSHQVNYYTGEPLPGGKGYIQLKRPQPSLFDLAENTTQKIRFSIADQMISETDCEHSGDDKSITFTMPSSLEKGTVYKLEIVDRSANNKEDIKYSTYFRTSRYATVAEKISSFASKENIEKNDELGFNILGYTGVGNEFFDKYEIMGTESVAPLIECEFSTDNDKWFRDLMQLLPIDVTEAKTHANISIVGGAPAEMTDEQARLGTVSFSNSSVQISTDVDSYCYSVWKSTVVPGEYPRISKGGHVVNIKYTIPGKDKKNTEVSSTTINL